MQLSLSVLPGPQLLDVLPKTWASASVEVLQLQYSFATGHFRPGVSCIVPNTSCPSTTRCKHPCPRFKCCCCLYVHCICGGVWLPKMFFLFVFLFASGTLLCFLGFFLFGLPYFPYCIAQRSSKTAPFLKPGLFLSSFLVRTLPPQFLFAVCVRSIPSNQKPFNRPQFPVLFSSLMPVEKKPLSSGQGNWTRLPLSGCWKKANQSPDPLTNVTKAIDV